MIPTQEEAPASAPAGPPEVAASQIEVMDAEIPFGGSASGVPDDTFEFSNIDITEASSTRFWCTRCGQSLVKSVDDAQYKVSLGKGWRASLGLLT